jgi:hypothetical protein
MRRLTGGKGRQMVFDGSDHRTTRAQRENPFATDHPVARRVIFPEDWRNPLSSF